MERLKAQHEKLEHLERVLIGAVLGARKIAQRAREVGASDLEKSANELAERLDQEVRDNNVFKPTPRAP